MYSLSDSLYINQAVLESAVITSTIYTYGREIEKVYVHNKETNEIVPKIQPKHHELHPDGGAWCFWEGVMRKFDIPSYECDEAIRVCRRIYNHHLPYADMTTWLSFGENILMALQFNNLTKQVIRPQLKPLMVGDVFIKNDRCRVIQSEYPLYNRLETKPAFGLKMTYQGDHQVIEFDEIYITLVNASKSWNGQGIIRRLIQSQFLNRPDKVIDTLTQEFTMRVKRFFKSEDYETIKYLYF